jgi:hypothetical protein
VTRRVTAQDGGREAIDSRDDERKLLEVNKKKVVCMREFVRVIGGAAPKSKAIFGAGAQSPK